MIFLLFASCGYRFYPEHFVRGQSVCVVPFVEGDEEGIFTSELIAKLSQAGIVHKGDREGYRLVVKLLPQESEKIGFRIDPQKVHGKVRKNLLALEGRKSIIAEISLWEKGEKLFDKVEIEASADYDFVDGDSIQDLKFVDRKGQIQTVLPFSLGQLEPEPAASSAATFPLYRRLAEKIVDYLNSGW